MVGPYAKPFFRHHFCHIFCYCCWCRCVIAVPFQFTYIVQWNFMFYKYHICKFCKMCYKLFQYTATYTIISLICIHFSLNCHLLILCTPALVHTTWFGCLLHDSWQHYMAMYARTVHTYNLWYKRMKITNEKYYRIKPHSNVLLLKWCHFLFLSSRNS